MLSKPSAPTWKTLYERETQLMAGFKSIVPLPENYQEKINLYRLRTVIWKVVHNLKFNLINQERLTRFYNALTPFEIS
jgi:fructosamine-3-kinase